MSEDIVRKSVLDSRGPSTRRIKLLEEAYASDAIKALAEHSANSRDWARAENKPFHPPVSK